MNKEVLVLSSSPRKGGNSDLLCDQFIKGAQEAGSHTEKILITNKKINYCTGCATCFKKKKCFQQDDMREILEKMVRANVIVMATPVYFYAMNGQMKTLIDRTGPRITEINKKDFYFILTAADTDNQKLDRTLEEFRGFTSCLDAPNEKGVIYGTGATDMGDVKGSQAMNQAYEMGKNV
jgi:multimeric flavodoxin WrbA